MFSRVLRVYTILLSVKFGLEYQILSQGMGRLVRVRLRTLGVLRRRRTTSKFPTHGLQHLVRLGLHPRVRGRTTWNLTGIGLPVDKRVTCSPRHFECFGVLGWMGCPIDHTYLCYLDFH